MSRGAFFCLLFIWGGILFSLNAQEPLSADTAITINRELQTIEQQTAGPDSIAPIIELENMVLDTTILLVDKPEFKPNSTKAVIYSAIFPGLGQAYNRKYWKLPIVYGGAIGIVYAITWNGRVYNDYNQAFRDLVLNVPNGAYMNYLQPGQTPDNNAYGGREPFQNAIKRKKDFFRRNRDLAIIAAVGVYALCMIDAYVDAQLYDFDVSPDLSMRVAPVVWGPSPGSKMAVGLQCNIIF